MSPLVEKRENLRAEREHEQQAGQVNSLASLVEHQRRRQAIRQFWRGIEKELHHIKEAIRALPALPPLEHIRWAHAVAALPSLTFLEMDTTGLQAEDEMIRFPLVNRDGDVCSDWLCKPIVRQLSPQASAAHGITLEQLTQGLSVSEIWPHLQEALMGRYVLSFNQEWDRRVLHQTAEQHGLEPLAFVGECLQHCATPYYRSEYSLTLESLCERIGAPLPAKPHQTSIDRARGQRAFFQAFASAWTDVQPPQAAAPIRRVSDSFDPFVEESALR